MLLNRVSEFQKTLSICNTVEFPRLYSQRQDVNVASLLRRQNLISRQAIKLGMSCPSHQMPLRFCEPPGLLL